MNHSEHTMDVLIVAYKNPNLLRRCLDSVSTHLPTATVRVWDNSGPDDGSIRALSSAYPGITWTVGSANIGFAAAVNALAAQSDSPSFLLLNPDAELLCDLTRTRALLGDPTVAAAAPMVVEVGREGWDVAHRPVGVTGALIDAAWYSPRLRGVRGTSLYRSQPTTVDGYLTGACLLISATAWHELGEFDEEFFLYGEESDWQRRARQAGYELRLADEWGVAHTGHGTVRDDHTAARRSADLLRGAVALNLEKSRSKLAADVYLAGTTALDVVQRSKRRARNSLRRTMATDKPAVVITVNRLVYGGAERHHVVLATELARRGHPVTIVCIQRFGPLIKEIPAHIRVIRQPWWMPVVDLPLSDSDTDTILITGDTNTETGFGTLWSASGRMRGSGRRRWLVGAHVPPNDTGPTYSAALARAMCRADGFITLADAHREAVTAHQRVGQRYFVAPNGVVKAAEMRNRGPTRGTDAGPWRLVMLSRIVEHKNPHILVEALAGLTEFDWRLDIFGDGPDRDRLEAMTPASVSDRVHWRGWSPGPHEAFTDADVLCVPSKSEAFPLVIVEAMARGLPVAASAVCAVPEMLDHGRAGIVVEAPTVSAWRTALHQLFIGAADPATLGNRGYHRAAENYTVEAMADAYQDAITRTLEDQ